MRFTPAPQSTPSVLLRQVDLLGGLEWLRIETRDHQFEPHMHDHFVVGMVESGTERFLHRGRFLLASAGELSLVNPEEVHTGQPASGEGYVYRAFYPQQAFLEKLDPGPGLPFFRAPVVDDPELSQRLLMVHQEICRRSHLQVSPLDLGLDTELVMVFQQLLQRHTERRSTLPLQQDRQKSWLVRDFLETHIHEVVRLETLAELIEVHPVALVRMFRREHGLPPHAYQIQRRIDLARKRLKQGRTVAAVAADLGFFDQSHFTRHFRRIMGVTPGVYQQAVFSGGGV